VTTIEARTGRPTATDTVAGFLAVGSFILSALAIGAGLILQLDARPVRTSIAAGILALVAARLSARHQSLAFMAVIFATVAWVVGLTLAVITENPLI
jgi:hypothetical protein